MPERNDGLVNVSNAFSRDKDEESDDEPDFCTVFVRVACVVRFSSLGIEVWDSSSSWPLASELP